MAETSNKSETRISTTRQFFSRHPNNQNKLILGENLSDHMAYQVVTLLSPLKLQNGPTNFATNAFSL
jgi:hypothetical protein